MVYADTPAVDGGATYAQVFIGRTSLLIDVYGMLKPSNFIDTLLDCIRERGAMSKLVSDFANVEISKRVKDVARSLYMKMWQSEPGYQHQHFFERRWRDIKVNHRKVMNHSNAPPNC